MIKASRGRLLAGHSATEPVKLTGYPDFEHVPELKRYSYIADYMLAHETDLMTVSEQLRIPLSHIFDFFNACIVLGYIERPAQQQRSATTATSRETQNKKTFARFLGSILAKKG